MGDKSLGQFAGESVGRLFVEFVGVHVGKAFGGRVGRINDLNRVLAIGDGCFAVLDGDDFDAGGDVAAIEILRVVWMKGEAGDFDIDEPGQGKFGGDLLGGIVLGFGMGLLVAKEGVDLGPLNVFDFIRAGVGSFLDFFLQAAGEVGGDGGMIDGDPAIGPDHDSDLLALEILISGWGIGEGKGLRRGADVVAAGEGGQGDQGGEEANFAKGQGHRRVNSISRSSQEAVQPSMPRVWIKIFQAQATIPKAMRAMTPYRSGTKRASL